MEYTLRSLENIIDCVEVTKEEIATQISNGLTAIGTLGTEWRQEVRFI